MGKYMAAASDKHADQTDLNCRLLPAERQERPPLPTVVPMCVIVDDRADVYDSVSNQALLQVRGFRIWGQDGDKNCRARSHC